MKYDAVVFDLDGTLIDTLEDLMNSVNYALAEFGFPARTYEEIRTFVGNGVRRLVYLSVPEGTPDDVSEKCLDVFKEHYRHNSRNKTRPYNGIPELLKAVIKHKAFGVFLVKLGKVSRRNAQQPVLYEKLVVRRFPRIRTRGRVQL